VRFAPRDRVPPSSKLSVDTPRPMELPIQMRLELRMRVTFYRVICFFSVVVTSATFAADDKFSYLHCVNNKSIDWIIRVGNNHWSQFDVQNKSWSTNQCNSSPAAIAECRMDDSEILLVMQYQTAPTRGDTRTFRINRYSGILNLQTRTNEGRMYESEATCQRTAEPQMLRRF
jgi:hypothetical protein